MIESGASGFSKREFNCSIDFLISALYKPLVLLYSKPFVPFRYPLENGSLLMDGLPIPKLLLIYSEVIASSQNSI
jgi:hypothetical protein